MFIDRCLEMKATREGKEQILRYLRTYLASPEANAKFKKFEANPDKEKVIEEVRRLATKFVTIFGHLDEEDAKKQFDYMQRLWEFQNPVGKCNSNKPAIIKNFAHFSVFFRTTCRRKETIVCGLSTFS